MKLQAEKILVAKSRAREFPSSCLELMARRVCLIRVMQSLNMQCVEQRKVLAGPGVQRTKNVDANSTHENDEMQRIRPEIQQKLTHCGEIIINGYQQVETLEKNLHSKLHFMKIILHILNTCVRWQKMALYAHLSWYIPLMHMHLSQTWIWTILLNFEGNGEPDNYHSLYRRYFWFSWNFDKKT